MPHPHGSNGNALTVVHTFEQAYNFVSPAGVDFRSTTDETMNASQGVAGDGTTPTIVLRGENNIHGRVCNACWGFMQSCTGERIGQAIAPLDSAIQLNT
jgi:hypothetical protein